LWLSRNIGLTDNLIRKPLPYRESVHLKVYIGAGLCTIVTGTIAEESRGKLKGIIEAVKG